jgi:quercetin dioxygenase-like cupin family protein
MKRTTLLTPEEAGVIRLPEAATYSDAGIVSRTVLATKELRVVLFAFAAGQELTDHTSPSRALVMALDGVADFKVGDKTHELRAGDLLHMPPNAPHAVLAREPFSMLLVLQRSGE